MTFRFRFCLPRFLGIVALTAAAALAATPAGASLCGDVCEVSIRPGVIAVELPLDGWVYDAHPAKTVTVVEAPRFGTWSHEEYTPDPDFWRAGGDRLLLQIDSSRSGESTRHTIVFKVASDIYRIEDLEDFEGSLSWSVVHPEVTRVTTNAIVGQGSLEVTVDAQPEGASAGGGVESNLDPAILGDGVNTTGVVVIINATPPDNPAPPQGGNVFGFTVVDLGPYGVLEMRYVGTHFEIRSRVEGLACTSCATPWRAIDSGVDYRISMWMGRQALQHPSNETWSLEMISGRAFLAPTVTVDQLRGISPPPHSLGLPTSLRVGAFDPWGNGTGVLEIDELESWRGLVGASSRTQLVENFDDGLWTPELIGVGNIQTGLGVTNDELETADDWAGLVEFTGTSNQVGTESRWMNLTPNQSGVLWTHMELDVAGLSIPPWTAFTVLEAETDAGTVFLKLTLREDSAGDVQVRAYARDGSGSFQFSPWLSVTGHEVDVDLAWDGPEGTLFLWLDGLRHEVPMSPGPYLIDRVSFGAKILSWPGTGFMPQSAYFSIDDVAMTYATY